MTLDQAVLRKVEVVNVGLLAFGDAIRDQDIPVVDVDWRPPAAGDREAVAALERVWGVHADTVAQANEQVVERMEAAEPRAVAVATARDVLPVLREGRTLIHSGPPIEPHRLADPQRRALIAACLFEGWADDRDRARAMLEDGEIGLASGNEHDHVGAMTGVCSPSMPVWVVEDESSGARAFSTFNEGAGKTLWFGTHADEAIERLRFFRDDLGPLMKRLLERLGPIEIFKLAAQGLHQGDELHMRSQATGNLLIRDLLPGFAALGGENAARFLSTNWHFFLSLTMCAAKCALLAGSGVRGSTIVSLMSRNGTEMGLQLAAMPGRWFIAEAPPVKDALLREGYQESDAAKDIGDSAVIECVGLGGMAVGAAPAVAAFFGGDAAAAISRTERMREICAGRSTRFTIPSMDSAPTPVGIDARLVCELGIAPQITTGVLHVSEGVGQIGAGIAHQPIEAFRDATIALASQLDRAGASAR
ncbi:MAG TPA: DUF1116 domain-containing protein [Solirubrobacteraceae bacterium]|nr:DUF1116 domain-containing protein [Solirubrobacteraceae bacterium]